MNPALKSGSLFIPLLFLLSLSGFFLIKTITVKSFEGYQAEVSANFDKKYDLESTQYALSNFIGAPSSWKVYTNREYNYQFKYPDPWTIDQNSQTNSKNLNSVQIVFADKIKLSVDVKKANSDTNLGQKIKINDNEFYLNLQNLSEINASSKKNDFNYKITLTQNNFFANQPDFKNTFIQILKNFEFVN